MDTKYEDILNQLRPLPDNPYNGALAQAQATARQAEMQRQMYEARDKQRAMEYEAMLKAEANRLSQKLDALSQPAYSQGTALTEDSLLKEIDRMREEEERVKKAEDKKKRQKNANTLEKLLRHEFQKTKT